MKRQTYTRNTIKLTQSYRNKSEGVEELTQSENHLLFLPTPSYYAHHPPRQLFMVISSGYLQELNDAFGFISLFIDFRQNSQFSALNEEKLFIHTTMPIPFNVSDMISHKTHLLFE